MRKMNIIIGLVCLSGSSLSFYIAYGGSKPWNGILYALFLIFTVLASDMVITYLFQGHELFSKRRITIISYTSIFLYTAIMIISSIPSHFIWSGIFPRTVFFATSIVASIRALTISVFYNINRFKKWFGVLLQPLIFFLGNIIFFVVHDWYQLSRYLIGFMTPLLGTYIMIKILDNKGKKIWKGGLLNLFRGFILAWTEDVYDFLEKEILPMGEKKELEGDILLFQGKEGVKTGIIIPYIHPGPFRKMGSSALPEILVDRFRKKLGYEVVVAHGISNHELDIIDSRFLEKIFQNIVNSSTKLRGITCTEMIRRKVGHAQASCQIFNKLALITLTLSPKSHDDLPLSLLTKIREEGKIRDLEVAVVDCHNSLKFENDFDAKDREDLLKSAVKAMDDALKVPRYGFQVGVSRVIPDIWSIDDGMGGSGLASIIIVMETGKRYGYLVIDGNNMISGLRESIVEGFEEYIDELIVMTSDTHVVNALGAKTRGYSPIGEKMDTKKLVNHIDESLAKAINSREESEFEFKSFKVSEVPVLGESGLQCLADILERGFHLFKRSFLTIPLSWALSFLIIFCG
jgi:predicted neutral ceramidase superfamily lipid hydrolase